MAKQAIPYPELPGTGTVPSVEFWHCAWLRDHGKTFVLDRETPADHQLLDALDMVRHVQVLDVGRMLHHDGDGFVNCTCVVLVDRDGPAKRQADAAAEVTKALQTLLRHGGTTGAAA